MKMKLLVGGLIALVMIAFIAVRMGRSRIHDEYLEQLRLARAEGLPTSGAEYAATIVPAAPSENAAAFYRQMKGMTGTKPSPSDIEKALIKDSDPKALAAAETYLGKNKEILHLADQATALPRCWFDRPWADGLAVLMPEYAYMKSAAKFLALRGSVAARSGQTDAALKDGSRIFTIALHAGEEGHALSRLVRDSLYVIGLRRLATWASMHPDQPAYRRAFVEALKKWPEPDPKKEFSADLYQLLDFVEMMRSPEGRAKIGLKPDEVAPIEKVLPLFVDREKARIEIVKKERNLWALLNNPSAQLVDLQDAVSARDGALFLASPTAADVYQKLLDPQGEDLQPKLSWLARHQQFEALGRVLEAGSFPRSIKTSDLLSPYDGKPLKYRFDGKKVSFEVSGPAKNMCRSHLNSRSMTRGVLALALRPRSRRDTLQSMTELLELAAEARGKAYAPYSGYKVGVAVLGASGRILTGCNVENVSYGASICAERTAIVKMVSEGDREIKELALITKDGGTPCGMCLQVMLEFSPNPAEVIVRVASEAGTIETYRLSDLIPHGFHSKSVPRTER